MKIAPIVLSLTLLLGSTVRSQSIKSDPFINEAIAKEHFEPGGRHFTFSDRGTIVSRSGEFIITPVHAVNVGSYSLQSAHLSGTYHYVNDLSAPHPIEVHGQFANEATSEVDKREDRQGGQSSYKIKISGSEMHPADAFDGGGGAGARDLYSYRVEGIATGVYFVTTSQRQSEDLFDLDVWAARVHRVGPRIVEQAKAGLERGQSGVDAVSLSLPAVEQVGGGLDIYLGVRDLVASPVTGFVGGLFGEEIAEIATYAANKVVENDFKRWNVEPQFAAIGVYADSSSFLEANPIYKKFADAATSASVVKGLKPVRRSGLSAAAGAVAGRSGTTKQKLGRPFSSRTLTKNLEAAGHVKKPNDEAHHIVAGKKPLADETREILQREGIDINEADNGVFLPGTRAFARPPAHTHRPLHTEPYYKEVTARLKAAPPGTVRDALNQIRQELVDGTFPR